MKATVMATVGLLAMGVAQAQAEDGRVSQSTLSDLGLGDMQVVSDEDGMEVRGEGRRRDKHGFGSGRSAVVIRIVNRKNSNKIVIKSRTKGLHSTPKHGGHGQNVLAAAFLTTGKTGRSNFTAFAFAAVGGLGHIRY